MSITIIAGKLRGKQLVRISKHIDVRPILVRVRKSLFDIIRPKIEGGVRFLDLYAGSGTVGIEALSRGAEFAVFIDLEKSCVRLIRTNLERFGLLENTKVSQANVLDGLDWLRYKSLSPFDIVFLGPPYPECLVAKTLKTIVQAKILSPSAWVIAQHHKKEDITQDYLQLFRQERYGDTMLSFFKNIPENAENKIDKQ